MGVHVIKMPDLGEGIAEVELVAWHVKAGDLVAEDQALADVMTDKATVEIPSPVVGKVLALGGEVGQVLAVGAELIRIEVEGAGAASEVPAIASKVPQGTAEAPARPTAPAPLPQAAPATTPSGDKPIASPAIRRRAWELGIDLRQVAGRSRDILATPCFPAATKRRLGCVGIKAQLGTGSRRSRAVRRAGSGHYGRRLRQRSV